MQFEIYGTQRRMRVEAFGTSATAMVEGTKRGSFTANGTGDFTITFTDPYGRTPTATASALHSTSKLFCVIKSLSTTAIRVLVYTDAGVAADPTNLYVQVIGSDSADGQL